MTATDSHTEQTYVIERPEGGGTDQVDVQTE